MFILLKGLILGFSIAAPVGPIGILCIRRTIAYGRLYGFFSGLGAATADAIYGLIAGFGLTFIMNFLLDQQFILQAFGGLFLCYLGVQIFRSNPAKESAKANGSTLFTSYFSVFLLTISNPMTIMSFLGVFAGLGIGNSMGESFSALYLVIGVFVGSAFWWLTLSIIVGLLKDRFNTNMLSWVNKVSGLIIIVFGTLSIINLIFIK
ncbi:LysE family translocator [Peribacillus tepidiphilus]|uniref:LysE family translocator n=1 Tax=Peribacillus tepidiphilus TaxID=2652445 RepID=UPI0035B56956